MRLVDRIRIEASPEVVWAYVGDPEQWLGFHPKGTGVEVVETFEITGHGLPWFVRWIARFINRFGRPVGLSSLTQLKGLLEPQNSMVS